MLTAVHGLSYWIPHSGSHLKEKDWSKRPEQEDVDMWSDFMQAGVVPAMGRARHHDSVEKFKRMAERHGLDAAEVKRRVGKVAEWITT